MATVTGPQLPEGVILFSLGDFSYSFLRVLETTNHGETVMIVQQRSRLGPEGNYIARRVLPHRPRTIPKRSPRYARGLRKRRG